MSHNTPITHYLKDYAPSEFQINSIFLTFDLAPFETRVINTMNVSYVGDERVERKLVLNGTRLTLLDVRINDRVLKASDYELTDEFLTLNVTENQFTLEITTQISPQTNTSLDGLYRTNGNYCTQCEALGFQTITYYLDRPDVLSEFTTKIIADKSENSVLLSNGNLIESDDLPEGKHYAVWQDPYLKPCYLFALVAGNLELIQDSFTTMDNRVVDLRIYVEPQNIDKCHHAMASLKKSMRWDEERYGLAYDLDIYMIVAVDDFNMGAMENKGLNVFNSKFVLAKPETATDVDYEGIESVIAHEYFHNWTGNRVTCRDWFQLTLKEGLTVFRDQEFTADMLSPAVKRIEDVKRLRNNQFPEDAGPMAHPIQPQSYIEMNNFYTMTVYEKGAEVVRMYQTLLGREGFRKGMDLYFKRHDGQAVTVQDFRAAMADANQVDLDQMHHWYIQAGTPTLRVETFYDSAKKILEIHVEQVLQHTTPEKPLYIPLVIGFLTSVGDVLEPPPKDSSALKVEQRETSFLLKITQNSEVFIFGNVLESPVISYLRDFSAPIILETKQSLQDLSVLARYDSNAFVRWESLQLLALKSLMLSVESIKNQQIPTLLSEYQAAFESVLLDDNLDNALKSLALSLPDLGYLVEQYEQVPLESVNRAYLFTQEAIAEKFEVLLHKIYMDLNSVEPYEYSKEAIGRRKLKNTCLKYLVKRDYLVDIAVAQFQSKQNMTDVLAALEALSHLKSEHRQRCLDAFYKDWSKDSLVLDKWFALQAASQNEKILMHVKELIQHPDFKYTNPNRVRSVLGVFGRLNLLGFHDVSGEGYRFLAEQVIKLNAINPQIASRLVAPFTHWKRYDEKRQVLMKSALNDILKVENLSKDVYEIVSKTLG